MTKGLNCGVARDEREVSGDKTDARYGIPDADEFDVNVHGECLLESRGLSPTNLVHTREHLVCKWDLLVITGWQQSDLETVSKDEVGNNAASPCVSYPLGLLRYTLHARTRKYRFYPQHRLYMHVNQV